jgi:hypothetical protein
MVDREVNPLEQRHLALSARFKAAWAFHQLLVGMQRLMTSGEFKGRSESFQSLFSRLKTFAESMHGATAGLDERSAAEIGGLEREVRSLYEELTREEEAIAPSELRRFFGQVRALDDRILIEVVRFYLEIQKGREWTQNRLDKIDYLVSRLAERIAGPDLQSGRVRLDKVLEGLLSSADPPEMPTKEREGLTGTLQDLRSEVRWVKTFEELNESRLVEIYRALKHDMGGRIFHSRLLPLVVEVNSAFSRKINELRGHEESRLMDQYQELSQLQERARPRAVELQAELTVLQEQVEHFRDRARSNDVRLGELVELGDSLREVTSRLRAEAPESPEAGIPRDVPKMPWFGGGYASRAALVPDLDCLQPQWSELLQALAGFSDELDEEQAVRQHPLDVFRLESREILAFRRTVGAEPANVGLEQFILAAAALRHRIDQNQEEIRGLSLGSPVTSNTELMYQARESIRMADAYTKHFSHLAEQAVFDGDAQEARDFLTLRIRLLRESCELSILQSRTFAASQGSSSRLANTDGLPVEELAMSASEDNSSGDTGQD